MSSSTEPTPRCSSSGRPSGRPSASAARKVRRTASGPRDDASDGGMWMSERPRRCRWHRAQPRPPLVALEGDDGDEARGEEGPASGDEARADEGLEGHREVEHIAHRPAAFGRLL